MNNTKSTYKKGDRVSYTKDIMFKGPQQVTATVVGIFPMQGGTVMMMDNGDEFLVA